MRIRLLILAVLVYLPLKAQTTVSFVSPNQKLEFTKNTKTVRFSIQVENPQEYSSKQNINLVLFSDLGDSSIIFEPTSKKGKDIIIVPSDYRDPIEVEIPIDPSKIDDFEIINFELKKKGINEDFNIVQKFHSIFLSRKAELAKSRIGIAPFDGNMVTVDFKNDSKIEIPVKIVSKGYMPIENDGIKVVLQVLSEQNLGYQPDTLKVIGRESIHNIAFDQKHDKETFQSLRKQLLNEDEIKLKITEVINNTAMDISKDLDHAEVTYSINKINPDDKAFFIDFVGTANLQGSIAQANEDVQGSAGLGVIFERYLGNSKKQLLNSYDIESYINVASSVDQLQATLNESMQVTNQRLFGSFVLNPVSSKQSVFINANVYSNPNRNPKGFYNKVVAKVINGISFRAIASNALWRIDDNDQKDLGILSLRVGVFHEFLPDDKIRDEDGRRKYSVYLAMNQGWRIITGDLSSPSNDDLRARFLGTTDMNFSGLEVAFGFRLNNVIAEFMMPSVGGSAKTDIDGLTDTQFLFSIRFVGGFSLNINQD